MQAPQLGAARPLAAGRQQQQRPFFMGGSGLMGKQQRGRPAGVVFGGRSGASHSDLFLLASLCPSHAPLASRRLLRIGANQWCIHLPRLNTGLPPLPHVATMPHQQQRPLQQQQQPAPLGGAFGLPAQQQQHQQQRPRGMVSGFVVLPAVGETRRYCDVYRARCSVGFAIDGRRPRPVPAAPILTTAATSHHTRTHTHARPQVAARAKKGDDEEDEELKKDWKFGRNEGAPWLAALF